MKIRNWFWGLFFVIAAVFVILNQLGYLGTINVFTLLLTIFLIPIIIKSSLHLNFAGILFPIALLCIIYAEPLGITSLVPWTVLIVALLGSIGLSIMFQNTIHRHYWNCGKEGIGTEHFNQIVNGADGSAVELKVSFNSSIKYVNTDNFQRANLGCSFGALKVYFDNAKIPSGQAEISIDASFGGVELYIPKTWKIVQNLDVSFAGAEEKNNCRLQEDSPTVILTGRVNFAGVEIVYI